MKFLSLVLSYACLVANYSLSASSSEFRFNTDNLRNNLNYFCGQDLLTNYNLVDSEALLMYLMGVDYTGLLTLSGSDKRELINNFISAFCLTSHAYAGAGVSAGVGTGFSLVASEIKTSAQNLLSQDCFNLVNIEYFLHKILNYSYQDLLRASFGRKQGEVLNSLHQLTGVLPIGSGVSPVVTPVPGVGVSVYEPGFNVIDDVDLAGVFDRTIANFVNPALFNRVGLQDHPMVGKYLGEAGYPMASLSLILKNNLINRDLLNRALAHVEYPAAIRAAINGCAAVDFFTEILVWDSLSALDINFAPVSFDAKNREFNLVFHGTMMSWFADKYPAYNFSSQSISENLLIGLFNYTGIEHLIALGNNELSLQSVNPHDGHFSPDNTRFRVADGRNLVAFWSIAKSQEKNRAIVTYHILLNGDYYPNQAGGIAGACNSSNNLQRFLEQINQIEGWAGNFDLADRPDWQVALAFLTNLYGA